MVVAPIILRYSHSIKNMTDPDSNRLRIEWLFFLAVLVVITGAFVLVIAPFFGAIVWGVVAAVLFQSVFERINSALSGRANLAAFLTLLLVILLVIIPAIFLVSALAQEASNIYTRIQAGEINFGAAFEAFERSLPIWAQNQLASFGFGSVVDVQQRFDETIANSLEFLITQSINVGQGAFQFLLALGAMLYLTFFLLRDGRVLAERIERVIPLAANQRRILIDKFFVVIRATIKGSFVVAILQGTLGGLIFWALDIRGALIWAVAMGILSLIPAIGTGFVWAPVAVYLLVTGSIWQGVVLILCGFFIISMIDNIVRPILVGRDTRMPDYVVLISTLGGLQLFGINGIVIGPLVAALFIANWSLLSEMRKTTSLPPPEN